MIRNLRADEVECRVQQIAKDDSSCMLLIYKDARCDMKILDETYGILGWSRKHELINGNLFCTISLWNDKIGMWVEKQDVGIESNAEKEKGEASDSFKRACFNIGIGRELYTAPDIWINLKPEEIKEYNGKTTVKTKFNVSAFEVDNDKEIIKLCISDNKGNQRFIWSKTVGSDVPMAKPIISILAETICPVCQNQVTGIKFKGKDIPPSEVLQSLKMCHACYKAQNNT